MSLAASVNFLPLGLFWGTSSLLLSDHVVQAGLPQSWPPEVGHVPWACPMGVSPETSVGNRSGLLCSPPGDLPDPGIELSSLMSPALAGQFFTTSVTCNSIYPSLVMCTSRLEQLWEFLNYCNLESQLGKSPRPCIHPVGETSHCSFGDSCL